MSAGDVLNHHLQAFGAGDLDAVMADYTEDSVLITPDGAIRGLEGIRGAFAHFFGGLFKPGTYSIEMDHLEIVDDVAYIAWHSTNVGASVPLGTDTLVVRDGKIAVQTFAAWIVEDATG